ncbi:hypothetical protein [Rhodococcus wratislaviensis]|uniref:Uncharacterized protein n=1 Tax=Rhodococcus wratislaviensis NBRC 100605 TaxID=1219028 RepID=X0PTV6_RHOWR|nr:hypothetical protein [Rhodococcus wratislaviensis]GAF46513.1 hypothetical protein RW1_031_00970 [Rhodococcus wratislaviensis NBRC 100605]
MKSTTRSQIVITGPRSSVSELVVALESEELGRTPGTPPLPIDTVTTPKQRTCLTPSGTARQVEPKLPSVTGPTLATTETGILEVRYTVQADGSSARAVEALASQVPELTVVLAEQREADRTELTVYRGGRRIAAVDCACNGIVVLPSRHHLTLQECIVQASERALVTGSLLPFAVLDDVRGNGTLRHDAGAWTATVIDCTDGTTLTLAQPDPEVWTAQMVLAKPRALADLLPLQAAEESPIDALPAVFDDLLPYALFARDAYQLRDIAVLACAWATGRTVDAEVEEAVAELCRRLPVRAVAEAAIGSDEETPAREAIVQTLNRLSTDQRGLRVVGGSAS